MFEPKNKLIKFDLMSSCLVIRFRKKYLYTLNASIFCFRNFLILCSSTLLAMHLSSLYALTLSNSVQYAVNNIPDIKIKQAQHGASSETIKQARSSFLPSVDIGGGYGREYAKNPVATTVDGDQPGTLTRGEFGIDLKENIFDGFSTENEVKRTKNETLAAKYEILGESNNLSLNITEQYLNVLLQEKLYQLAKQNVVAHKNIANMINERKQAGLSRESEITQAQSRIALAESNLISQQSLLDDARAKFERLVKLQPNQLVMPSIPHAPNIPRNLSAALSKAYVMHPILKSAQADIKAAVAQYDESKFTDYPKIDLVVESDRNRNIDGVEGPNDNNIVMLRATYNIFKGGEYFAKQRETAYAVVESREIKNRTILQIKEAVNLAWIAMTSQDQRKRKLYAYKINAVKTLHAYEEEFKLNKRSLLDVLDSQNEVFQSSLEFQTAKYDEIFARYRLLNTMGMLNQFLHVNVSVATQDNQAMHALVQEDSF